MSNRLYISTVAPQSGKSLIALGVMNLLSSSIEKVCFFRPVIRSGVAPDNDIELIRACCCGEQSYESAYGVTHGEARQMVADGQDKELLTRIYTRFKELQKQCDYVLCEGTDFTGIASAFEFEFNAQIANHLGCPVLIVVSGLGRTVDEVVSVTRAAREEFLNEGCTISATMVNRVRPEDAAEIRRRLQAAWTCRDPVYVLPEHPSLMKPTLDQIIRQLGARPVHGSDHDLRREVMGTKIAAMQLANYLEHIREGDLIITPADRADIILGSLAAVYSQTCPTIVGMVLSGGMEPAPQVEGLIRGLGPSAVPVFAVSEDTYHTAMRAGAVRGRISPDNERKIATALGVFEAHVPVAEIRERITTVRSTRVTPIMFEHELIERAKTQRQHIVLPEGNDERILRASEILLRRGVVDLTLLGDEQEIRGKISSLGLDLQQAKLLDPLQSPFSGDYARTYYELRKHKGIAEDYARDVMRDVSYFGTMMVYKGAADGMVSGAAHTTAHTIRPAFEFIRTRPGCSIVSSVFFMCLADRVLVYGDCAVIPNPTAEQLADIAVSSAATAALFGVEPRVAMLSYSTGASGTGEDVERVREATRLARERCPELMVDGPIQYDAAIDASVAKKKMPESEVAGRATVFIFPDLNTGNNTYKAVQRSANAVAVGPVLQGLKKPVNDLSRGCQVPDIVNTVAITAIQAQNMAAASSIKTQDREPPTNH
jgi:phosphate acetyltransferase